METLNVPVLKVDSAQRLVKGPALRPEKRDRQKTIVSKAVIAEAAHEFMVNLKAAKDGSKPGVMHAEFGVDVDIVESWLLDTDVEYDITPSEEVVKRFEENPALLDTTIRVSVSKNAAGEDVKVYKAVLPEGTWMVAMHIRDDKLWEKVERGEFRGFSIGGDANVVYGED